MTPATRRSARVACKADPKEKVVERQLVAEESPASSVPPMNSHVKIYVVGWEGEPHLYRIRDCAWAMGRLKRKYARKCGMDPALILDGRTLRDIECPLLLCLEDGDRLEVGWAY
ncbi:hypothetical protein PRIPAC_70150 [Pristionchus pacificus]|uniref:Uncharacterized protein n=1 Tax=Pristionchus pacificus TaxID=54126 RepID=A0A2A6C855_PRIPA|nr:hypothetical protein PRIPAC_70150 [Pristionchus pacificus]|eukprot:PDM74258.1 hypothetical protein PRIPAC_41614 [Pristionchus pacificus]